MKYLPCVAGGLLGLLFIASSAPVLFGKMPEPPKPPPADVIKLMSVFVPLGYLMFVKIFEFIGGILVAIPKTRNLGLLTLGPIILNILFVNLHVAKGEGLLEPMGLIMTSLIVILPLYLLWVERKAFAGLVNRPSEK